MLNINAEILSKLTDSEYYLLSILCNYGKKSHPKNDVLLKKTGWGLGKLQSVKSELIKKNLLVIGARFDLEKGGKTSNEYTVNTKLISNFKGNRLTENRLIEFQVIEIRLDENRLIEIRLDENRLIENRLDENRLIENRADYKVLKLEIIETIKSLKEEREKDTLAQIQILNSEIISLKTELEKEKSSAKKEVFPIHKTPAYQEYEFAPYQVFLQNYSYPKNWSELLITNFLLFCQSRHETMQGKFGATNVKLHITAIIKNLPEFGINLMEEASEQAARNNWADINPKYTQNKRQREIVKAEKENSNYTKNSDYKRIPLLGADCGNLNEWE